MHVTSEHPLVDPGPLLSDHSLVWRPEQESAAARRGLRVLSLHIDPLMRAGDIGGRGGCRPSRVVHQLCLGAGAAKMQRGRREVTERSPAGSDSGTSWQATARAQAAGQDCGRRDGDSCGRSYGHH